MKTFYENYIAQLETAAAGMNARVIEQLEEALLQAILARKQVFVLGNGGSAAAATHWACDFNKGVGLPTGVYPRMISLSDQVATFTAIGNDLSYDEVFSQQLRALMQSGDVLLLLSVSGKSKNLLLAAEYARTQKCQVLGIFGDYHGPAAALCDIALTIPSQNYGVVEDLHVALDHMLSQSLMERLGEKHD